jgi:hypothetical protein
MPGFALIELGLPGLGVRTQRFERGVRLTEKLVSPELLHGIREDVLEGRRSITRELAEPRVRLGGDPDGLRRHASSLRN